MSDPASPYSTLRRTAYIWDGGLVGFGPGFGMVPQHSHHVVQISIALEGAARARRDDTEEWRTMAGVVIAADAPHEFDRNDATLVMLFVDPESIEGRWLASTYREPIAEPPAHRFAACRDQLEALWRETPDADGIAAAVAGIVRGLCSGPAPTRALDPRITKALEVIRSIDVMRLSQEEVASAVYLSSSRFAHLFRDELGLPFRRYVLWRKMARALSMVGHGSTLSAAAHASGFSDSAHLTRTCYQMFGVPPTQMFGAAELHVVPAPFEIPESPSV